jgi:hypothetical protein
MGIALAFAVSGDWFLKFWYVLVTPVIPIIVVGATFARGTDPEGAAFSWLYALMPLVAYLFAAAAITLLQTTLRSEQSEHSSKGQ